ncbi:nucleotidyltransferase domain-containing protein [Brevibacillus nitrificans]|uniref:Nucleotidyltransferase domain-containing protein n=1 Tax=Brevibacillus nitrificans TaxID=651560 RepID=A0A3M8CYK1_9BACL|nr:nucleotidyltransferase domain-containing protein [Brevibacillus nitrificans]RNB80381.1 nucleotidyltransferase domain-containing protein [Brevibacillus nitrificans]
MMFPSQYRADLRSELIRKAQSDPRIRGAAVTGSASVGKEDPWSDIDLFFGLEEASLQEALADWTEMMYASHDVVHHIDVMSGATIYRVFLLRNTLQVDLAFAPLSEFGARGSTFQLLFGEPVQEARPSSTQPVAYWIGVGFIYALHVRACVRREQWWRAEFFVRGIRDTILTLACMKYSLPLSEARGIDSLPKEVTTPLEKSLVRELNANEVLRAFQVVMNAFLMELQTIEGVSSRIAETLTEVVESTMQT